MHKIDAAHKMCELDMGTNQVVLLQMKHAAWHHRSQSQTHRAHSMAGEIPALPPWGGQLLEGAKKGRPSSWPDWCSAGNGELRQCAILCE